VRESAGNEREGDEGLEELHFFYEGFLVETKESVWF